MRLTSRVLSSPPHTMKCPNCGKTMMEGHIRFREPSVLERRQSTGVFLFELDNGETVKPKLAAVSHLCPACETIVLPGVYGALKCFECGKPISEDDDACPGCGWTWK